MVGGNFQSLLLCIGNIPHNVNNVSDKWSVSCFVHSLSKEIQEQYYQTLRAFVKNL